MAPRTPSATTALVVSPRGQITLPKPVRARLRLAPGSVLLLREEAGKIVLDPAAVTAVSLYSDEEIERLVRADRVRPRKRAALRRRWDLKAGARRRRARGSSKPFRRHDRWRAHPGGCRATDAAGRVLEGPAAPRGGDPRARDALRDRRPGGLRPLDGPRRTSVPPGHDAAAVPHRSAPLTPPRGTWWRRRRVGGRVASRSPSRVPCRGGNRGGGS